MSILATMGLTNKNKDIHVYLPVEFLCKLLKIPESAQIMQYSKDKIKKQTDLKTIIIDE